MYGDGAFDGASSVCLHIVFMCTSVHGKTGHLRLVSRITSSDFWFVSIVCVFVCVEDFALAAGDTPCA